MLHLNVDFCTGGNPLLKDKIDQLLDKVERPARYGGGEMNTIIKPWENTQVRFAFCFPDTYEIAMSHLGMKILYHIVNRLPWALCERVILPWVDMLEEMEKSQVPLFSLESRKGLYEFDVVGFTLQYEMSYTNILEMLSLGKIPLFNKERGEKDPIVVAGGPCAFNPEPLHAFIDAFMIGDGEEVIVQVMKVIKQGKEENLSRKEVLQNLALLEGVYVPDFYEVTYHENGTIASFEPIDENAPKRVKKALVTKLHNQDYPDKIPVPYTEIIHDRIMLEIMRGCTKGCRFCQAGMLYRPIRERSVEELVELAEHLEKSTGYEEMSLSSLSSGDYTCLSELTKELMKTFEEKRVSISLPSLRIDSNIQDSLNETQKVRKSNLTFAPEAGSQRLRDVINKGVQEEDLINRATEAFEGGWNNIKLYFMIGLPTENFEDLQGIADLAQKVVDVYYSIPKEKRARGLRITCSASSFIPKAFTPFQWDRQDTLEEIQEKQQFLRKALKIRGVTFNWHESYLSVLEACFARGDRNLAKVLYRAWILGCRFDGWDEHFKYDAWMEAFKAEGIEPAFYANRERTKEEILPWDFVDAGVTKSFLWKEREKALKEETTIDCREGCIGCGIQRWKGACNNAHDVGI